MKKRLKTKFLSCRHLQDNYTKLYNLGQEYKSVKEYIREFESLVMTCDIRESEDQVVLRYWGGLNKSIRKVVELQYHTTLSELCSLAHKVEPQNKDKLKREMPKPPQRTRPFNKGNLLPIPKPTNRPTAPKNNC